MIKKILKKIVGEQRISEMKGHIFHYLCSAHLQLYNKSKLRYDKKILYLHRILTDKKYHIFRGYYDLDYLNEDRNRILCHRLPVSARTNREDICELGYYNLDTGDFHLVAESHAWCWQQGSRLRWSPLNSDYAIFNDTHSNGYCSKIINIITGKVECLSNWALYDFTPDLRYGISLNFSRLQRLRPGYGYNYFKDETEADIAPEDDGIWIIDIKKRTRELMFPLRYLAEKIEDWESFNHYVNHICVSPDGKHFIFFHIITKENAKQWRTILYVVEISSGFLKPLESIDRVSHYCWIDNSQILITLKRADGSEYYAKYNISTGKKNNINIEGLDHDGHPRTMGDYFITDTYPLEKSIQYIYFFRKESLSIQKVANIYHDYRMRGEKRCDLHPSVSTDNSIITVDTTYYANRRSVLIFKNLMK